MDLNFDLIAGDWKAALNHLHLQQILGLAKQNRMIQALVNKLDAYDLIYQEQHDDYEEQLLLVEGLIGADLPLGVEDDLPLQEIEILPVSLPKPARKPKTKTKKRPARVGGNGRYVKLAVSELDDLTAEQRENLRKLVADKLQAYP